MCAGQWSHRGLGGYLVRMKNCLEGLDHQGLVLGEPSELLALQKKCQDVGEQGNVGVP